MLYNMQACQLALLAICSLPVLLLSCALYLSSFAATVYKAVALKCHALLVYSALCIVLQRKWL